jgi:hypothetical protein
MNERGSILIVAYVFLAIALTLQAASLLISINEQRNAERTVRLSSAFQMAEAGLDQAIVELRDDSSWEGVDYTAVGSAGGYEVEVTDIDGSLRQIIATGHYPANDPTAPGYQSRQIEAYVAASQPAIFEYALFAANTIELDSNATVDSYDSADSAYGGDNVGSEGDIGSNSTSAPGDDDDDEENGDGDDDDDDDDDDD